MYTTYDPGNPLPSPFNNPVETGLRSLVLLCSLTDHIGLHRLLIYDYLLVHSEDASAQNGPTSLHPATPKRSGELLVKREFIHDGLMLMVSRELINVISDENGFGYTASQIGRKFLSLLESEYAIELQKRASWVVKSFESFTELALDEFAMNNLDKWE